MKINRVLPLLVLVLFLFNPIVPALASWLADPEAPDAWTLVAPGIEYQKIHRTSPRHINIFIARMDRGNQNVTIDSSIAQGRLSGGTETVSGMSSRYDQAINYWGRTWGNRNRVVVAINGYFFGPTHEPSGVPWSGQIHSSWYAKRYTDIVGDAGFVWALDREAFIGKCVSHRLERNDITFPGISYDPNINAINVARSDESLILYTPQYDSTTRTLESGGTPRAEILVELNRPSLLISDPSYVRGTIRQIRRNDGSTPIPFDHVVIAAWGAEGDAMVRRINDGDIEVGNEVRITQEITDCAVEPQHDWGGVYAGIGGDYHFLRGGAYFAPNNSDATVPNSRTAIALNNSYIFYVVVDGFDPGVSMGMTIRELSDWLESSMGATDAVSLDSGGSSTMVVNGVVVNNTTCNYTRDCGSGSAEPPLDSTGTPPSQNGAGIEWSPEDVQPFVGNGMMMVAVEPLRRSSSFQVNQPMTVLQQTSLRLGPGTNYATRLTLNAGAQGTVQSHSINGVLAKGSYWWKLAIGGSSGWVREEHLQGGQLPPPADLILGYLPLIAANMQAGTMLVDPILGGQTDVLTPSSETSIQELFP